ALDAAQHGAFPGLTAGTERSVRVPRSRSTGCRSVGARAARRASESGPGAPGRHTAHATRRETAGDPGSTRPGPAPLRLAPAAAAPRPAPRGLLRGGRPGRPGGVGLGEHVPLARPPRLGSSLLAVRPGLDGAVRHHRVLRLARAASPPPGGGQEGDGVLGPAARVEPGLDAAVLRRRP